MVWGDEPLPPHELPKANAKNERGRARTSGRLRFRIASHTKPGSIRVHATGVPDGRSTFDTARAVVGAVVATCTVALCVALPVICNDEGRLQVGVGPGVAAGLMLQLKLTVPVNVPVGANTMLKLAVCPALTV